MDFLNNYKPLTRFVKFKTGSTSFNGANKRFTQPNFFKPPTRFSGVKTDSVTFTRLISSLWKSKRIF